MSLSQRHTLLSPHAALRPARWLSAWLSLAPHIVAIHATGLPDTAWAQTPIIASRSAHPESESGRSIKAVIRARDVLAVTAHPLASEAAYAMLAAGGSAVDAAIAAQAVLTLVEPQSSGIGGGGFMLHYDPPTKRIAAYDGRETAPEGVDAGLFARSDGTPLDWADAVVGGRSVGVPGLLRMLEQAHGEHGRLAWASLFEPAIRLARHGFSVSPRLHTLLSRDRYLSRDPSAAALYYQANGEPVPTGYLLRNPELAQTFEQVAQLGAQALYQGPIAEAIAKRVQNHATNPGSLSVRDLASYRAERREAVCAPIHQWLVCGMPPPSAGGIAVAQILGLYAARHDGSPSLKPIQSGATARIERAHRLVDSIRLAFADRDRWVGDPRFANIPVRRLIAPDYLALRSQLLGERALESAPAGDPLQPAARAAVHAGSVHSERDATTHLSIIDASGRAVSMTSSIEDAFGARLMVGGFLLNNQLTDFSWRTRAGDATDPNRVQAGKRPRSSMSPTLVFARLDAAQQNGTQSPAHAAPANTHDQGADLEHYRLMMALGSPGGPAIISYVARTLVDVLFHGETLQQAIESPHIASRQGPVEIESIQSAAGLADGLIERGHRIRVGPMTSGLHGIIRVCDTSGERCVLESGTDPRREGLARGH